MQKFETATIKADGTREGTTITVNGKEIKNLASFGMHFWNDDYGPAVSLRYSVEDKNVQPGTLHEYKSYHLVPPQEKSEAALATAGTTDDPTIQAMPDTPADLLPRSIDRRTMYAQF